MAELQMGSRSAGQPSQNPWHQQFGRSVGSARDKWPIGYRTLLLYMYISLFIYIYIYICVCVCVRASGRELQFADPRCGQTEGRCAQRHIKISSLCSLGARLASATSTMRMWKATPVEQPGPCARGRRKGLEAGSGKGRR